ncbi:hypothetical protein [Microbacterium aurantiacum]|uniref:hypothetical protein n=1 Tax=Microbacterium aurantiacum TaxID=162393 RepID=UPI000C8002F8|nr:hypothetical protein [Microbacterium aurantiacum]
MIPPCDFEDASIFNILATFRRTTCGMAADGLLAYPYLLQWIFGIVFAITALVAMLALLPVKNSRPLLQIARCALTGTVWFLLLLFGDVARMIIGREFVPAIADAVQQMGWTWAGILYLFILMLVGAIVLVALVPAGWIYLLVRMGRPKRTMPVHISEPAAAPLAAAAASELPRWGGRQ